MCGYDIHFNFKENVQMLLCKIVSLHAEQPIQPHWTAISLLTWPLWGSVELLHPLISLKSAQGSFVVMLAELRQPHNSGAAALLLWWGGFNNLSGPEERPTWTVCKANVHAFALLGEAIVRHTHWLLRSLRAFIHKKKKIKNKKKEGEKTKV